MYGRHQQGDHAQEADQGLLAGVVGCGRGDLIDQGLRGVGCGEGGLIDKGLIGAV